MNKLYIEREVVEQTPRTDAVINSCGDYEKPRHYAARLEELARTLEKELRAALSAAAEPVKCGNTPYDEGEFSITSPSPAPAVPDAAKPEQDDDAPAMTLSSNDYAEFWERLPGHLIDNHEGEELTEELLQRAAADLYAKFPDLVASGLQPFGLLLLAERATTRQLSRALREATEPPTFMGEPMVAAKPETQGERALLEKRLREHADAIEGHIAAGAKYQLGDPADCAAPIMRQAAALLSAGSARVEPLTEALLYCRDDYNYLLGITENKDNLHGWLRMRLANVDLVLNKKGGV